MLAAEEAMPEEQRPTPRRNTDSRRERPSDRCARRGSARRAAPEAADQLRAAWAALQSAMAETGPAEPPSLDAAPSETPEAAPAAEEWRE